MADFKRGSTLKVLYYDFEDAEWDAIQGYQAVWADARQTLEDQSEIIHNLDVVPDMVNRRFLLRSDTIDWNLGTVVFDLLFEDRNGDFLHVPMDKVVRVKITRPVTERR